MQYQFSTSPIRSHWADLKSYWPLIVHHADRIYQKTRQSPLGRYWTGDVNTHLPGYAGEVGFALLTGRKVRTQLLPHGDDGVDFRDPDGTVIDVKTATRIDCRVSLCHDEHPRYVSDIYVLMVVDLEEKRAGYVGWERKEKLLAAPVISLKEGVEARHTLREDQIHPDLFTVGYPWRICAEDC